MRRARRRGTREPVIALINIIFLILIFFMVTGTLSRPPDGSLQFVQSSTVDCCVEPNAMAIASDGRLSFRGLEIASPERYLEALADPDEPARLLPDRNLPARDLLEIVKALKGAGAEKIVVLTENTGP